VAVVGFPDDRLGEVGMAFVVRQAAWPLLSSEDILTPLRGKVASFKIPRHVHFVDALPMTASGKVRKVELRAAALERSGGNAS
jgi:acyl-CoA synthetase (AMP-forming)/AMP-acid ligase II